MTNWIYIVSFLAVIAVAVWINFHDGGWFGHGKTDIPVQRWEPSSIIPELLKQKGFVRDILNQAGTNSIWKSVKRFMNPEFDYVRFEHIDAGYLPFSSISSNSCSYFKPSFLNFLIIMEQQGETLVNLLSLSTYPPEHRPWKSPGEIHYTQPATGQSPIKSTLVKSNRRINLTLTLTFTDIRCSTVSLALSYLYCGINATSKMRAGEKKRGYSLPKLKSIISNARKRAEVRMKSAIDESSTSPTPQTDTDTTTTTTDKGAITAYPF